MSRMWDRRVALGRSEKPSTTRRSLPHVVAPGLIQHVTFHLADSLPRSALDRMQQELDLFPEEQQAVERRKRIQTLLDSGLGACVLQDTACAQIVEDSLLFGDGSRYRLLVWVVMPNHVHALIEPNDDWPLPKIVQSWKRHTSREIHRLQAGRCPGLPSCTRPSNSLWQRDYWDRYIRSDTHLLAVIQYIENNPVAAGLSATPEDWQWSSARYRGAMDRP